MWTVLNALFRTNNIKLFSFGIMLLNVAYPMSMALTAREAPRRDEFKIH